MGRNKLLSLSTLCGILVMMMIVISLNVVTAQSPLQSFEVSISGYTTSGGIYYGSEDNEGIFGVLNPENPVKLHVSFMNVQDDTTHTFDVCLNSNQLLSPVSGVNLQTTCPFGAFNSIINQTATNNTSSSSSSSSSSIASSKLKFSRLNSGLKENTLQSRLSSSSMKIMDEEMMVNNNNNNNEENDYSIYMMTNTNVNTSAFIVSISPSTEADVYFTLTLTGNHCTKEDEYPIGGHCVAIETISSNQTFTSNIPVLSWIYLKIEVNESFNSSVVNALQFTYDNSLNISIFVQQNYLPTQEWYIPLISDSTSDDDNQTSLFLYSPSRVNKTQTYFLAIYNDDAENAVMVDLIISYLTCSSQNNFGPNCNVDSTSTASATGIVPLSVTSFAKSNDGTLYKNVNSYSLTDSSYSNQFAYFQITDLPDFTPPYYIRLSVGNNDMNDNEGYAPDLFCKLDGFPSAQSFDIMASGEIVNQVYLPITNDTVSATWYVAVQLPSDFSIWVGSNCANNCSNDGSNDCMCSNGNSTVSCQELTNYGANPRPLFVIPTTTSDSSGVCTCSNSDTNNLFDCDQQPPWTLYIIVGVIMVLLVILLVFGIPFYVYMTKKREAQYELLQ